MNPIAAKPYDYKAWAKELRKRYIDGVHLLPIQISMASEALHEVWEKVDGKRTCTARNLT